MTVTVLDEAQRMLAELADAESSTARAMAYAAIIDRIDRPVRPDTVAVYDPHCSRVWTLVDFYAHLRKMAATALCRVGADPMPTHGSVSWATKDDIRRVPHLHSQTARRFHILTESEWIRR